MNHTLTASVASTLWQVGATSTGSAPTAPLGYTHGTEYWGLDADFTVAVSRIAANGAGSITLASSSSSPGRPGTGFAMPTDSLWTALGALPGGAMFWVAVPPSGAVTGYVTGVVFDLTAPAQAGAVWGGTMTWYVGVPRGEAVPEYVIGSAATTLGYGTLPTAYASYDWSVMTLPPLTWSASAIGLPIATSLPGLGDGDPFTTCLAAVGTRMFAAACDVSRTAVGVYQTSGPSQPWATASGIWGSWSYSALAAVGSTLYLAMQNGSRGICLTASSAPALAAYNGRLFLACVNAGSTHVWLCSTAGGVSWSGYENLSEQSPDVASDGNPALAALGRILFLAWAAVPGSASQVATLCTLTPQ